MVKAPPTPKGFRDILPELAKKRRGVINTIANVLEESGFVPVETPTIEFAETLKGKYGEEEKLIYEFTDRGNRNLALRYDLTVPLARFVASNLSLIERGPFRRYQVGQVFRGENPQRGRFREFTQFDFDIVGSSDISEDAKIIEVVLKSFDALRFDKYKIFINDRAIFEGLEPEIVRSIDKLKKLGREQVLEKVGSRQLEKVENAKPTQKIKDILQTINNPKVEFSPTLARGLDYYTGMIFEVEIEGYPVSVASGGRYDNLIGTFAKREIPAVGGSFGIDRLIDAMAETSV
ncbi:MAG TPA: ATP phosphoribosyltransferase regulatory subunit [Patescibacteria group bacterium]|nr:ATP phosphoribosyltransferase regulatory subunit [Patescibacteria group bacterium]